MARMLELPTHIDGTYCIGKLAGTYKCEDMHAITDPVLVPENHNEIYSAMMDHLFLNRVGQETAQDVVNFLNEAQKRYLQIGQYARAMDVQVEESGATVIPAATR